MKIRRLNIGKFKIRIARLRDWYAIFLLPIMITGMFFRDFGIPFWIILVCIPPLIWIVMKFSNDDMANTIREEQAFMYSMNPMSKQFEILQHKIDDLNRRLAQ